MKKKELESLRDKVLAEYEKRNIVFAGVEGLEVQPIDEFVKQPEDGILYDLNRNESVVLTFIDDSKWVNDYAVCKTIRVLKSIIDKTEAENERLKAVVSKQEELIIILEALPVAVGKRSVELWEKFTELETELEKLKAE